MKSREIVKMIKKAVTAFDNTFYIEELDAENLIVESPDGTMFHVSVVVEGEEEEGEEEEEEGEEEDDIE